MKDWEPIDWFFAVAVACILAFGCWAIAFAPSPNAAQCVETCRPLAIHSFTPSTAHCECEPAKEAR